MATSRKPELAIIDYGMGNLRSVQRAWEAVGAAAHIVQDPQAVNGADALVFPGQGAIRDCMRLLGESGFDTLIRDWVAADKPFFGICLGLQALFEHSEEADCPCLGLFPGSVRRFRLPHGYKVPHMGWNAVQFVQDSPVSSGLESGEPQFYFVHSYYVDTPDAGIRWGETEYGGHTFTSAARSGRCHATQFHPEKSQAKGLLLYRNFLASL